ncbi:MAG: RNA methyltransferase [Pseudomonadota bacterium]
MRGYFGIGVERISKSMNLGSLQRSAHAFDASFFFTVAANLKQREVRLSDTSAAAEHLPVYHFPDTESLTLPRHCRLVGIELTDDAIDLPSFQHPTAAAYILGPERGSLSPEMQERCDVIVKIPTRFCINVGLAGALVMYDRVRSLGRFPPRPASSLARPDPLEAHVHGAQKIRSKDKNTADSD